MRCWSSNLGFSLHPGQGFKILDYFLKVFLCSSLFLVEKPFLQSLLHLNLNRILLFACRIALSHIAQPDLLPQITNASSPMFLLLVIFTLPPERIALDWSGFSCESAYFWQYLVLSDQENTVTAFSSQKAPGMLSWWTAEWLFAGRGNEG